MLRTKSNSQGFTLIAALLMLTLMSAASIGLFMMVNTEAASGGHDLQNAVAYRKAEGGIEHMTSDLADLFTNIQNPSVTTIQNLTSNNPDPKTYVDYSFTPNVDSKGKPVTNWTTVPSGTFQGLYSQSLDVNLLATAQTSFGDQASIMRTVQLDMIPVFQFGVFSEPDLAFVNNPTFDFAGRVHTNGDLYLDAAQGATVTFHDKLEAYGNVIREVWPNGVTANGSKGTIDIPTASKGCDATTSPKACLAMTATSGSVIGLPPIPSSTQQTLGQNTSPAWTFTSKTTYNGQITDGDWGNTTYGSGALNLNLPFVTGSDITKGNQTALQHQILSPPPVGEDPASALGQSRLYNEAQIRILLVDNPAQLPGGAADPQNIRLANTGIYQYGVPTTVSPSMPAASALLGAAHFYTTYFATATTGIPDPTTCDHTDSTCDKPPSPAKTYTPQSMSADWVYQPASPTSSSWLTLVPNSGSVNPTSVNSPLIDMGTQGVLLTATAAAANINPAMTCAPLGTAAIPGGCLGYPYYTVPDFPSTYYKNPPNNPAKNSTWNLIDGYLRVEALESGSWVGITQSWLQLGIARGATPPTTVGTNPVNPNAILIFQEAADRSGNGGAADALGVLPNISGGAAGVPKQCANTGTVARPIYRCETAIPPEIAADQIPTTQCTATNPMCAYYGDGFAGTQAPSGNWIKGGGAPSITMYNWYPVNFYDKREGEPWDVLNATGASCTANGVMNAVELDVGNLNAWLATAAGKLIDPGNTNGYIVYFSDRRGMLPNGGALTGEYGFEDTINLANSGVPDGKFEPTPSNKTFSPEDVDEDGTLETLGADNVGLGFGVDPAKTTKTVNTDILAGSTPNPYLRFSCSVSARQNWVSGARHVLRLVDGQLGQVPLPGFTVGSENPVYVLGDYNSITSPTEDTTFNNFDPTPSDPVDETGKSNAAIVADAVTLLSNNWMDWGQDAAGNPVGSLSSPQDAVWHNTAGAGAAGAPTAGKTAKTTSYRVSIATGKSVNFQNAKGNPTTGGGSNFGIDGGVGNFLRLLEDWCSNGSSCGTQQTLYYSGSMVNLFYSEYATGTFKCCDIVYNPPVRRFMFDNDLSTPAGLPPGTPTFRDVDNLSYRQIFTQRTNADR
jgi:hypothetical protein